MIVTAKYADVRDLIQDGDALGFAHAVDFWRIDKGRKRGSLQTLAIRLGTGPKWLPPRLAEVGHLGVAIEMRGRKCCMEATGKGVFPIPISELVAKYNGPVYWRPLRSFTGVDPKIVAERAAEIWGSEYCPLTQYLFTASPLLRRIAKRFHLPVDVAKTAFSCVEAFCYCYQYPGSGMSSDKEPCEWTPVEAWNWPIFVKQITQLEL